MSAPPAPRLETAPATQHSSIVLSSPSEDASISVPSVRGVGAHSLSQPQSHRAMGWLDLDHDEGEQSARTLGAARDAEAVSLRWPIDMPIATRGFGAPPGATAPTEGLQGLRTTSIPGFGEAGERRPITAMVVMTGASGPTITLVFAGSGNNLAGLAELLSHGDGDSVLRQVLALAAPPTPKRHLCVEAVELTFPTKEWCGAACDVCTVCMEDIEDGEQYRSLQCCHSFHTKCIDQWLSGDSSQDSCDTDMCPNCRAAVVLPKEQALAIESSAVTTPEAQSVSGSLPVAVLGGRLQALSESPSAVLDMTEWMI